MVRRKEYGDTEMTQDLASVAMNRDTPAGFPAMFSQRIYLLAMWTKPGRVYRRQIFIACYWAT
jgi:hypothetical protein